MLTLTIFLSCVFTALGAAILAGASDYKGLTISNIYTLVVLGGFSIAYMAIYLLGGPPVFAPILSHILSALIVFGVTAVMFTFGALGAADSKLGTAFALWVGLAGLPVFLFWMALMGGILGLAALIVQKKKPFKNAARGSWLAQVQAGQNKVPYGIAIAFGAVMSFAKMDYLSPALWQLFL